MSALRASRRSARGDLSFGGPGTQTIQIPRIPPGAIAAVALLLAVLVGRFFADGRMDYAGALVLGICFVPLVLLDLPIAFAVYVGMLFMQGISALSVAPNSMGVLVLLGWLGTFLNRSARTGVLRGHSRLLLGVALFALWLSLSALWAGNPGATGNGVQDWLTAMLGFVVVLSMLRSVRHVTIITVAFVIGATASVCYGIASGGLSTAANAGETAIQERFVGGGADANVQAAGFLVAMFLCAGLWSLTRSRAARGGLLAAFTIVAIGFFATQSRGGFISLAFASVAAFVLLPRQRKRLLVMAGAAGAGLGVVAILNGAAVARITDFSGGTSGRSSLWTVAWKIFNSHPLLGIGLSNFQTVEPHYALRAGPLNRADLVAEIPHLVHNVYLQMLTECGVIGFALFMLVMGGCLRASWLAARRFDASGHVRYGDLARTVLMAEIAMLSALFFISDAEDPRLWILLGLGPVLLSIARRSSRVEQATKPPGSLPPASPAQGRTALDLYPRASLTSSL